MGNLLDGRVSPLGHDGLIDGWVGGWVDEQQGGLPCSLQFADTTTCRSLACVVVVTRDSIVMSAFFRR